MSNIYDKASLVLIPSGTKTSKVFSQKPVNGDGDFTFSRSTAATRVNADGNIEKETQNLLLQSNGFDSWGAIGSSVTSGQAGYDGTNDAWLVSKNVGSARVFTSVNESGVNTYSVYAKAGALNWVRIMTNGSNTRDMYFDLANGVLGTSTYGGLIDSTITSVGSGWYRCTISVNETITLVRVYPADSNGFVGGTSGNIYIQDAQLEQGLVARDYIETTTAAVEGGITDNVPRLDYTDSSCPALLLEPQRTNIVPDSEYIVNWSQTNATTSSNQSTSPEGVNNASLSTATGTGAHAPYDTLVASVTSGANYTISIFYKKGTTNYLRFEEGYTGIGVDIDIDAESATPRNGATNANIEDYGNSWYRASFGFTGHGSGSSQIVVYIKNSSDQASYTASGENVYLYGGQIEAGSYATSYIPTYGTSVTRNADTNTITNALTSISGVNGLSLFFEVDAAVISGAVRYSLLQTISGSAEWVFLSYESSSSIRGYIRSNSSTSWDFSWNGIPTTGTIKVLLTMTNGGNGKLYGNGQLRVSNGGVVLSQTLDSVALGGTTGVAESQQYLKQFMVFPTALSNEEAIALTTI